VEIEREALDVVGMDFESAVAGPFAGEGDFFGWIEWIVGGNPGDGRLARFVGERWLRVGVRIWGIDLR